MTDLLPWHLQIDDDSEYLDGICSRHVVKNEAGLVIAYCFSEEHGRLLAAAPDLLAALKAVEEWWLSEGMKAFNGAPYAMFATRAVIAKAGGAYGR